jgi:uncharacterized membrane protein
MKQFCLLVEKVRVDNSEVRILEDNPDLSRWKLASGGFEFTWLSRIVKTVPQFAD